LFNSSAVAKGAGEGKRPRARAFKSEQLGERECTRGEITSVEL